MDKLIKGALTALGEGLRMFTFREDDNGVCSIRLTLRCCTTAVEESLAPGLFDLTYGVHRTHYTYTGYISKPKQLSSHQGHWPRIIQT